MMVTFCDWCASGPLGQSALSESLGPTGKPVAMKVARPVWSGGKAEKPYLSLLTRKYISMFSRAYEVLT